MQIEVGQSALALLVVNVAGLGSVERVECVERLREQHELRGREAPGLGVVYVADHDFAG